MKNAPRPPSGTPSHTGATFSIWVESQFFM